MEAAASPEDREPRAAQITEPPTREVVAAALLGAFGSLGLFVPIAAVGLAPLVFHTGEGSVVTSWGPTVALLGQTPLICVIGLVSAIGLARRRAWGRALGVVVGALALMSVPYRLLVGSVQPVAAHPGVGTAPPPNRELISAIEQHLFVRPEGSVEMYIPLALFGALVVFGLLSGTPGPLRAGHASSAMPTGAAGGTPRRFTVLALFLALLAVSAFGPYLAWLVGAATTIVGPAAERADWLNGLFLLLAGLIAGGTALVAARAVRRESASVLYLAPPAVAVAAVWTAAWGFLVMASLMPDMSGVPLLPILGAVFLPFPVTLALVVTSRARWRAADGAASVRRIRTRLSDARPALLGIGLLAIPVVALGSIELVSPRAEQLYYRSVALDGRAYQYRLSIESPGDRLIRIGTLDDWTPDLQIGDPTAYVIDGVGVDLAIVVPGSTLPLLDFDLFVRTSVDGVPQEYCQFVPVENPFVGPGPCGPPEAIVIGERLYGADTEPLVPTGDLAATGTTASAYGDTPSPGSYQVFGIRDVDPSDAVALRFGERVLVYRAAAAALWLGHPLCAYPTLTGESYGECLGLVDDLPDFVSVDGREFAVELDYYDIPEEALTPYGQTEGLDMPFPEGVSSTVYRIAGVDPTDAVGLIYHGRVRVARPNDAGRFLPSALCQYVRPGAFEETPEKGSPTGCPEP